MRLLLDAHVSGRVVGRSLRERGHDVRAADAEPSLSGLDDEQLLGLAVGEQRILVTFDVGDFPRLLRAWGEAGRSHAGVILVYGLRHNEFGAIVRAIEQALARRPKQEDWADVAEAVARGRRS
jgi:hypothetical protein